MTKAILVATQSDMKTLRSSATFALGVIGGPGAGERLGQLVEDGDDDVRYNAAIGLARQGADAAWQPLEEMLSLPDVVPPGGGGPAPGQPPDRRVCLPENKELRA